jgi:hypothetical protein
MKSADFAVALSDAGIGKPCEACLKMDMGVRYVRLGPFDKGTYVLQRGLAALCKGKTKRCVKRNRQCPMRQNETRRS